MSSREHAHTTVTGQQREIASLRRTNTALRARASHFHTRLLTALDSLDSLQSAHASELNALHDANAVLERRLSSMTELLRETVDERDDLRDAVERFIEKLELADGFHSVPVSKFLSSHLLEPLPSNFRKSPDRQPGASEAPLTSALVQTLQAELAREKEEHRYTWREAAAQIAALRAQVARRDAELEDLTLWGFEDNNDLAAADEFPNVTRKEVRILHAEVHKRRRDLDREVRKLNAQLEETRRVRSKELHSPPLKPSRATEASSEQETVVPGVLEPTLSLTAEEPQEHSPPRSGSELRTSAGPRPSTPTGPTHKSTNSQTQTHLTAAIFTTTPLKPGTGAQGIASAGRKIPDVFLPATPPTRIPHTREGTCAVSSGVARVLEELDQKIHALAEAMEEFKTERANLLNAPPEQVEERGDLADLANDMPDVWLLEEECIRLVEALRSNGHGAPPEVTPARRSPPHPHQQSPATPVRRSSNTHLTEITLGQGPSPIASYSLLSPSSVASEQDGQGHTTTLSSTNTPFDTAGAVYSSTEDDYREDTGGTNSVTPDSTDLGTVNIEPASNPNDLTPVIDDHPTLDLEGTLRSTQEELHRKNEEMKDLMREMERLQWRIDPPPQQSSTPNPDAQETHTERPSLISRNTL